MSASSLQPRDETLLRYLSATTVMSRQQIARLLWFDSSEAAARKRLDKLMNRYELIANFHVPKADMEARGLAYRRVYTLTDAGRTWLTGHHADPGRQVKPRQVLHDLLVAEFLTRFADAVRILGDNYQFDWHSERAASFYLAREDTVPRLMPDGVAEIYTPAFRRAFFIEVDASREAHVRPTSRIGQKITGYDLFYRLPKRKPPSLNRMTAFPAVLFITHGKKRLHNLAASIRKLRRQPVIYGLTLFEDLFAADDFFSANVWIPVGLDDAAAPVSLKTISRLAVAAQKKKSSPAPSNRSQTQTIPAQKKPAATQKPPVPQRKSKTVRPTPLPAELPPVFASTGNPPPARRRLFPFRRRSPDLPTRLYRQFLSAVKIRDGYDLGWLAPPTVAAQVWQRRFPALTPPCALAILAKPASGIAVANPYFIDVVAPDTDWQTKTQAYHYLRQAFGPAFTAGVALATLPQFFLLLNAPAVSVAKVLRPLHDASPPTGTYLALLSDFLAAPDVFATPIFTRIIFSQLTFPTLLRTPLFAI